MTQRSRLMRASSLAALCGTLAIFLVACGSAQQYDPPGQNSGSAQNAAGAFNLDLTHMGKSAKGVPIDVFNAFTTVTTRLTVTDVQPSTVPANTNPDEQYLPDGMQFLLVNVTMQNLSTSPTSCPNPKAQVAPNQCTEFVNPLTNFRLLDDQQRQWSTTTGAKSTCQPVNTNDCDWLQLLQASPTGIPQGGLKPGMTFSGQLAFLVPADVHTFDLYYAPYRFPLVQAPAAATTTTPAPAGAAKPTATPIIPQIYTVADVTLSV